MVRPSTRGTSCHWPSAADAWCAAEVDEAVVASAADGQWHEVPRVEGRTTFDA